MQRKHSAPTLLFVPADVGITARSVESPGREPAFAKGDRLWPLDLIDPRFARDPLFDASEEIESRTMWRGRRGLRRGSAAVSIALAGLVVTSCGEPVYAEQTGDSILVQLKPGAAAPAFREQGDDGPPIVPLRTIGPDDAPSLLRLPLPLGKQAWDFAREIAEDEAVDFAEPIYLYRASRTPDDARFKDLWGLSQIDAPAAWDSTTGDSRVVVAVVDDGVALDHPDLEPNLWVNPGEDVDREKDQDNLDDLHGFDFLEEGEPYPDEGAAQWHGSHIAGTIGAAGNNGVGVVGVSWNVSLMALRALGRDGGGSDALASAIDYATDHGARIINASWGGGGESMALARAVERAGRRGVLFVAAAGNDAAKDPSFPASLDLPNVLSVGALGTSGALAPFSNLRAQIAAPGVGILSTTAPGRYERYDGTSMAAAHASGVAALLWARHPLAPLEQVRAAIVDSAIEVEGTLHGGINAAKALALLAQSTEKAPSLSLDHRSLEVAASSTRSPLRHAVLLRSSSSAPLQWSASTDASWVGLTRTAGETPSRIAVSIDPRGLASGLHQAAVTFAPEAGEPAKLRVSLRIGARGPPALARGPDCLTAGHRVVVQAGTICQVDAPGIDPAARSLGLWWELPHRRRFSGGRLTARFARKGRYVVRVHASEGGADDVIIDVV